MASAPAPATCMKRSLDSATETLQRRRAVPGAARHDQIECANALTPYSAISPRQVSKWAGEASERLIAMCQRYGLLDIEELSDEIISRSETATRAAISKLKAGTFRGESSFDVPGGQVITLKSAVTIDPDAGEILVDFTGSTPQTTSGINVVLNYTHAYSTFAIRSCLNPDLPNNAGSLAPIKVHAPEGSILNCQYPLRSTPATSSACTFRCRSSRRSIM